MAINKDAHNTSQAAHFNKALATTTIKKELAEQTHPLRKKHRRVLTLLSTVVIIALIFAAVRFASLTSPTNDQLTVQIGSQQAISVDLRQSNPVSPYLYGVNTFPKIQTSSVDQSFSGFMHYDPSVINGLTNAHIKLLRFPGGNWGEDHTLSLDQLDAFSSLLSQVNADGMIQARLSAPQAGDLTNLDARANLAASWVDYMNNRKSSLRKNVNAPFHPVKFWTVGNEPDRLINPTTGKIYTVAEYTSDFIQFSKLMHQNDPGIKIFGPEISQFYGLGAGPSDATNQRWMEGFLKGIGDYEKAHHVILLDGISFHRYPFYDARHVPALLMSSPAEWDYLLPPLRQLARQELGRELPIGVTEVNSNPETQVPTQGEAALWWADTLGRLMNQQTEFVGFFSAEGVAKPYPLFETTTLQPTPMYRVMQIFTRLQPDLVPISMQREPISMYATQDARHDTVSLLFINKAPSGQLVQIRAPSQLLHLSPWHDLDVSLAGNSLVVVTIHRNGGAEADSYAVPTSSDTSVQPLSHVICGAKKDALATRIPC